MKARVVKTPPENYRGKDEVNDFDKKKFTMYPKRKKKHWILKIMDTNDNTNHVMRINYQNSSRKQHFEIRVLKKFYCYSESFL